MENTKFLGYPASEQLPNPEPEVDTGVPTNTGRVYGSVGPGPCHINPLLSVCVQKLQDAYDEGGRLVYGLPSGLEAIDRLTHGMHPGELTLIAGVTSVGKTALTLNIASNVAIDRGMPAYMFSTAASDTDLAMRILLSIAKVDNQRGVAGRLSDDEWRALSYALGRLHDAPIYIDATMEATSEQLCARARQFHDRCGGLGIVLIDHLSSFCGHEQNAEPLKNNHRPLAHFRALAKELNVPVIVNARLLLTADHLLNRRPSMLDIQNAGICEDDTDVILFLYREGLFAQPNEDDNDAAECLIGKQRHGPTGTVHLLYSKKYRTFSMP